MKVIRIDLAADFCDKFIVIGHKIVALWDMEDLLYVITLSLHFIRHVYHLTSL